MRDEMHVQDVLLLKEMGGNFLRVSHYPQDPVIMEMCDKLGIVTSVEIPVINAVTETEAFLDNSVNMAVEMVRQDFNQDMYYRLVVGEDDTYNMIVWNDDSDEITVYQFRKEGELYHLIQVFQSTTITKEDVVGKEDGVISIDSGSR